MRKIRSIGLGLTAILLILSIGAIAEGFLPPLKELFDTELPNMENAMKRRANETQALEDGGTRMVFRNIGRNEYTACSEYLSLTGCEVVENKKEGKTVTAVLEKDGCTFTFIYDAAEETLTVVYPAKTMAEALMWDYHVADVICFGAYPQTAAGDDMAPIEWEILELHEGKALLLSRYGLEAKCYNKSKKDVTWENCTLRSWLNGEFLKRAFSKNEQQAILITKVDNSENQGYSKWKTSGGEDTEDKVFLLSYAEANKYLDVRFGNSQSLKSRVSPTAYSKAAGAGTNKNDKTSEGTDAGLWWLRSPGSSRSRAALVHYDGSLVNYNVSYVNVCVRPAIWVNLDIAGTINSADEPREAVLPEPAETVHEPVNEPAAASVRNQFDVGHYVTLGHYPQTASGNDQTPVEWLVLAREGQRVLLLSRYGLEVKPYNAARNYITWETCTLRKWLNGEFLKQAFTADEQQAILMTSVDNGKGQGYGEFNASGSRTTQDKVFLLSAAEESRYLGAGNADNKNRQARVSPTAYAKKKGAYSSGENKTTDGAAAGWWWLRSPGSAQDAAAYVYSDGSLGSGQVNSGRILVRPALWIDLDAGIF